MLLFPAEHMLQRGISACRICLFRVDLLPLMLAKMCHLCLLFFLPARFLLDFCSFARLLLAVCSTCALQRSWPYCVVWHSVHNFTVSCVWCLGAVLYIFVLVRYSYYSSSMCYNGKSRRWSFGQRDGAMNPSANQPRVWLGEDMFSNFLQTHLAPDPGPPPPLPPPAAATAAVVAARPALPLPPPPNQSYLSCCCQSWRLRRYRLCRYST